MCLKILLLVGGSHHDSPEIRSSLEDIFSEGGTHTVSQSEDMAILNEEALEPFNVIVNATTDRLPEPGEHYALLNAVANGRGLVVVHGGLASFWNSQAYFGMVGSIFAGKSLGRRGAGDFSVKLGPGRSTLGHPITLGLEDYEVNDELFFLQGDQTQWKVLARAQGHPIMYVKSFGLGRVFVSALGHDEKRFNMPTTTEIMRRGARWAAGLL